MLGRRHLEAYLLDDEVITALCSAVDQQDRANDAIALKRAAVQHSVERGNDADDIKSAAGELYNGLRRLLQLTAAGSNWSAFARDTLAPLIRPGMSVYDELDNDIFGS